MPHLVLLALSMIGVAAAASSSPLAAESSFQVHVASEYATAVTTDARTRAVLDAGVLGALGEQLGVEARLLAVTEVAIVGGKSSSRRLQAATLLKINFHLICDKMTADGNQCVSETAKLSAMTGASFIQILNNLAAKVPTAMFPHNNVAADIAASLPKPRMVSIFVTPKQPVNYNLTYLGSYETGVFNMDMGKFMVFNQLEKTIISAIPSKASLQVIGISSTGHATQPKKVKNVDLSAWGATIGGIAIAPNFRQMAVSMYAADGTGKVVFLDPASFLKTKEAPVGKKPGQVAYSANGNLLAVVNVGSASISMTATDTIKAVEYFLPSAANKYSGLLEAGAAGPNKARVLNHKNPAPVGVVFDPAAGNLFVNCQVNNAMLAFNTVAKSWSWANGYGFPLATIDASSADGVDIKSKWDGEVVHRMLQPAQVTSFSKHSQAGSHRYDSQKTSFVVTANSGKPVGTKTLKAVGTTCGLNADMIKDSVLGTLEIAFNSSNFSTPAVKTAQGKMLCDHIYISGGRSFSIFEVQFGGLKMVADSGSDFERFTASANAAHFNDNGDGVNSNSGKTGAEPVSVTVGQDGDTTLLFAGLSTPGGVFMYDISLPTNPRMLDFNNHKNWMAKKPSVQVSATGAPVAGSYSETTMDGAVNQLVYVPASASPICAPLLLAGSTETGSISIYQVAKTTALRDIANADGSCATASCDGISAPPPVSQYCKCASQDVCKVPSDLAKATGAWKKACATKFSQGNLNC